MWKDSRQQAKLAFTDFSAFANPLTNVQETKPWSLALRTHWNQPIVSKPGSCLTGADSLDHDQFRNALLQRFQTQTLSSSELKSHMYETGT